MEIPRRIVDYLAAASIVVSFGCLFVGRLMIYPVATASGSFLERVATEARAWELGHRVMLVGMVGLIPAAIGLRRAMRRRTGGLADVACGLTILGAALGVGQYALDFAMLAAAQIQPPKAGTEFVTLLREATFVDWAFYKLPDLSQVGLLLFTAVLWLQGAGWRLQSALVTVAAAAALLGPLAFGAVGVRAGLGLAFLAFATVAWKIALRPSREAPNP
jgi:hypothetical protein